MCLFVFYINVFVCFVILGNFPHIVSSQRWCWVDAPALESTVANSTGRRGCFRYTKQLIRFSHVFTSHVNALHALYIHTCVCVSCSTHSVSCIKSAVSRITYDDSCIMHGVSRVIYVVARIPCVVLVYVLPEIGIPRLKTDSEVAVTALSEGFSPLAVLTLRLESLPYQRADTRHSKFPVFCFNSFVGT